MFGLGKRNGPETADGHQGNGKVHLIDLHQVVKTFETPAGKFTALRGVDLHIDEGEFVSIVGKSTLINMITGIDYPTSGEVWVGGTDVRHLGEGQMAVWRGRTIGVVLSGTVV
jgi:putative ABC transport system ATP-binding protein